MMVSLSEKIVYDVHNLILACVSHPVTLEAEK